MATDQHSALAAPVADCIVVCCCCQCLIMQILVFMLFKVPQKLLKKTKGCAKKLAARKRANKVMRRRADDSSFRSLEGSSRVNCMVEELCLVNSLEFGSMVEIEKVLEQLSAQGEFAFGSFWGCGRRETLASASQRLQSCSGEIDYDSVGCRLMGLFGSSAELCCH